MPKTRSITYLGPPGLLPSQASDKLGGTVQLLLTQIDIKGKLGLARLHLSQLCIQRGKAILDFLELCLLGIETDLKQAKRCSF
jgi:hypothetical protein